MSVEKPKSLSWGATSFTIDDTAEGVFVRAHGNPKPDFMSPTSVEKFARFFSQADQYFKSRIQKDGNKTTT